MVSMYHSQNIFKTNGNLNGKTLRYQNLDDKAKGRSWLFSKEIVLPTSADAFFKISVDIQSSLLRVRLIG